MNTTKATKSATKQITIDSILENRYGVKLLECDAITVEWAAGYMAEQTDEWTAGQAWRKADDKRYKMGKYTSMPDFNNPLFDAFHAKTREEYEARKARRAKVA